jgi:hypothetical protein
MARYDDYADDFYDFGSLPEHDQQAFLYDMLFMGVGDQEARGLFDDLMYNNELSQEQREAVYDQLAQYIWDEYGINFEEVWDWDDFRAWYDSQ